MDNSFYNQCIIEERVISGAATGILAPWFLGSFAFKRLRCVQKTA